MDLSFCENVIIKFLFTDIELRNRTLPYIIPEIFDDYNNVTIVKIIKTFHETFDKFPTMAEMKCEIPTSECYQKLVDIVNIDLGEYSKEYLLSECEVFIKHKTTITHFSECSVLMRESKFDDAQKYPDKIRESLSFSFDTKLGLDFLEEEQRLFDFLHGKDTIVPFNISFFDNNTKGGAHGKSLTLFLAETNLGKTLLMSSLAANNIRANKKVLYITCEMSEDKISERVISNIWDHDINELELINRDIFHNRYVEMKNAIRGSLQIKEYAPRSINCNDIRNLLKEYQIKKQFVPDILYLDYLELINPSYSRKADNSYSDGKRTAEEFRAITVDYDMPGVSALQTNRAGIGSSSPDLTNTSESIGYAFTADVVYGVSQPEEFKNENKFLINILKNRYGFNKIKGSVMVDRSKMRIYNVEGCDEQNLNTLKRPTSNIPTQEMTVNKAMNVINAGLTKASISANESLFGDWE